MILLDSIEHWDQGKIICRAHSHLDPANPLRRQGRLPAICALEYALQAAALHGALRADGVARPAGYIASLRDVHLATPTLDDPAHGTLRIHAQLEAEEQFGMIYALTISTDAGTPLVTARASIALPRPSDTR